MKSKPNSLGIKGFYAYTDTCDACNKWISEDYQVFFYKVADKYVCHDCHEDYLYNTEQQQLTNSTK